MARSRFQKRSFIRLRYGLFVDRLALARQDGFIERQLGGFEQIAVAGSFFPGVEHHQVAGHQLPNFHLRPLSIADDGGGRLEQTLQRHVGALRLVFLDKAQDHINHHDRHDDGEVAVLTQRQGDPGCRQDDIHQRAF